MNTIPVFKVKNILFEMEIEERPDSNLALTVKYLGHEGKTINIVVSVEEFQVIVNVFKDAARHYEYKRPSPTLYERAADSSSGEVLPF